MVILYSGTATIHPLMSGGGERLLSDDYYVYKKGRTLLRLTQGSGIAVASGGGGLSGETNNGLLDLTPESLFGRWILTHYLNDFAQDVGSIVVGTPLAGSGGPTTFFSSIYPEVEGSWITQSGYPDKSIKDLVGPDYPSSPRVVAALQDDPDEKVRVHTITGLDIDAPYATSWSAQLAPSGIVNDLEIVRII
jgi:hypothetical protein